MKDHQENPSKFDREILANILENGRNFKAEEVKLRIEALRKGYPRGYSINIEEEKDVRSCHTVQNILIMFTTIARSIDYRRKKGEVGISEEDQKNIDKFGAFSGFYHIMDGDENWMNDYSKYLVKSDILLSEIKDDVLKLDLTLSEGYRYKFYEDMLEKYFILRPLTYSYLDFESMAIITNPKAYIADAWKYFIKKKEAESI